ncbi:MAG: hypothetical protein OIF36_02340 [Alphaproteobacteria bacterium]|nr:hypothetical protein [Alphaproteobacteria bacterium]
MIFKGGNMSISNFKVQSVNKTLNKAEVLKTEDIVNLYNIEDVFKCGNQISFDCFKDTCDHVRKTNSCIENILIKDLEQGKDRSNSLRIFLKRFKKHRNSIYSKMLGDRKDGDKALNSVKNWLKNTTCLVLGGALSGWLVTTGIGIKNKTNLPKVFFNYEEYMETVSKTEMDALSKKEVNDAVSGLNRIVSNLKDKTLIIYFEEVKVSPLDAFQSDRNDNGRGFLKSYFESPMWKDFSILVKKSSIDSRQSKEMLANINMINLELYDPFNEKYFKAIDDIDEALSVVNPKDLYPFFLKETLNLYNDTRGLPVIDNVVMYNSYNKRSNVKSSSLFIKETNGENNLYVSLGYSGVNISKYDKWGGLDKLKSSIVNVIPKYIASVDNNIDSRPRINDGRVKGVLNIFKNISND